MPKQSEKLRKKITREYEKKGYGKKRATQIGYATAGKIYRRKRR